MEENGNRIGFCVHRLSVTMKRVLDARVKSAGVDEVTLMHGWIIKYLYENRDHDVYQKDIEKHCCVGRSTVTNIIQLMEKKGLISREAVENDARLKKVVLTPKGLRNNEAIEEAITNMNREMAEGIAPEDLAVFERVTQKMLENIQERLKE